MLSFTEDDVGFTPWSLSGTYRKIWRSDSDTFQRTGYTDTTNFIDNKRKRFIYIFNFQPEVISSDLLMYFAHTGNNLEFFHKKTLIKNKKSEMFRKVQP